MAYNFNGTDQSIDAETAVVTSPPLTFVGFFNTTSDTTNQVVIAVSDKDSVEQSFGLYPAGAAANDWVRFQNGNNWAASTTSEFSPSLWQHAAGISASNSNRSAFLNGGSKGTDTELALFYTPNSTSIGRVQRLTNSPLWFSGLLCECAIWNAALTDDEITSLAKGFKPTRIRPQSLVFYAPLLRNLQDLKGGLALTAVNSPTVADHPRVY